LHSFQDKLNNNRDSNLIVGLDIDISKIPDFLRKEKYPLLSFAKYIIDSTIDHVAGYKPNMAFFEACGFQGLAELEMIIHFIPQDKVVILDAKRSDIGNTARMYAKSAFEIFKADAVTVNPYMGVDSIEPFLEYDDKYVFALVLTSNQGSKDIQMLDTKEGRPVFEQCAVMINELNSQYHNCGAVVGATQDSHMSQVFKQMPDSYFLIPGIGTQGGSVADVFKACQSEQQRDRCLFNVSRDILYVSSEKNFEKEVATKAIHYKNMIEVQKNA